MPLSPGRWTGFPREGVAQTFEHIKPLLGYGVQYISYTEAHFRTTGPAGELMIAIAAWIAQQERIRLSERTKAGLEKARKQGPIGGRPRVVVDRDRLAELDSEGWTTREIGDEFGISSATFGFESCLPLARISKSYEPGCLA
jgi:DNA invertase Pin-like site-specific DNA recombinase